MDNSTEEREFGKYPKAKKPKDEVSYRQQEHCKPKWIICPVCGNTIQVRWLKSHKCGR